MPIATQSPTLASYGRRGRRCGGVKACRIYGGAEARLGAQKSELVDSIERAIVWSFLWLEI